MVALFLLLGCADDPCPRGSMLDNAGGLVVTLEEHPTGWGQEDCTQCHAVAAIHRNGCTPDVDWAALDAVVDEEGVDSCATCHGANGVDP